MLYRLHPCKRETIISIEFRSEIFQNCLKINVGTFRFRAHTTLNHIVHLLLFFRSLCVFPHSLTKQIRKKRKKKLRKNEKSTAFCFVSFVLCPCVMFLLLVYHAVARTCYISVLSMYGVVVHIVWVCVYAFVK